MTHETKDCNLEKRIKKILRDTMCLCACLVSDMRVCVRASKVSPRIIEKEFLRKMAE